MSDYQKNLEHFHLFQTAVIEGTDDYFEKYDYVYFNNKTDYMLWFIMGQGDFVFGHLKDLGGISFFFDNRKEDDSREFATIRGLLVEKNGMSVGALSDEDLKKLKRRIKRQLQNPEVVPEGVMPDKASVARFRKRQARNAAEASGEKRGGAAPTAPAGRPRASRTRR